jgi:hypothetical protein
MLRENEKIKKHTGLSTSRLIFVWRRNNEQKVVFVCTVAAGGLDSPDRL